MYFKLAAFFPAVRDDVHVFDRAAGHLEPNLELHLASVPA
jgi:hypothetical protein